MEPVREPLIGEPFQPIDSESFVSVTNLSSIIKGVAIFLRTFLLFLRHHSRYKEVQSDLEAKRKSLIGRRVNALSFLANERPGCHQ